MSRLIVNADDLGLTDGINEAVIALHAACALSSATAMALGPALPPAMPFGLGTGCHVVLVDGSPAADPESIPTLLEEGRFRSSLGRFTADLLRGRIHEREIEIEAAAQIRALAARGLAVTHVDTHKHTHLFPRVRRPLLRAALGSGVGAVRNPFEPAWSRAASVDAGPVRRLELKLLDVYREGFLSDVRRAGMRTTAGALGVAATGVLDAAGLERLLAALARHGQAEECYELVCHPGLHDAALDRLNTRLRAERERERTALLAVIPRWTGRAGPHRLVNFAQL